MRPSLSLSLAVPLALLLAPALSAAQEQPQPAPDLQLLAPFPEPVRQASLEAAAHPELLVKMAAIRRQSSASFSRMLKPYGRRDQEALWDLSRFPDLVDRLATSSAASERQLRVLLVDYPEAIRPAALRLSVQQPELIGQLADLNRRTERRFDALIAAYPPATQESARTLLRYPDALAALSADLEQTILLGDAYRQDPEGTSRQAAALSAPSPPRQELAAAGDEEAAESSSPGQGRTAQPTSPRYDYDLNGLEGPQTSEDSVTYIYHGGYYGYAYPYWYGYPSWHAGLGWRVAPGLYTSLELGVPLWGGYVRPYRPYYYHAPLAVWHGGERDRRGYARHFRRHY